MVAQLEQINPTDAKAHGAAGAAGTAQVEVHKGYDDFAAVKKRMTPDYDTGLHNVAFHDTGVPKGVQQAYLAVPEGRLTGPPDVPGQPAPLKGPADKQFRDQPGLIVPKDDGRFKTPVIPGPIEPNEGPIDEHGKRPVDDGPNPDLPKDHVETVVGADGKLKSVASSEIYDDGDVKTTFGFDDKGNVNSRSVEGPDGTDTVQFDANGKPISRTVTKPGSSTPEAADVNPDDTVKVEKDASGRPTSIESNLGDKTTKLTLDDKGNVTDRKVESDPQDEETKFDSDGRAVFDQTTTYDKDNKKTKTSTITPDLTTEETFDKEGRVVKTEEWDGHVDMHITNEKLPDGSSMSRVQSEGTDSIVVNRPDGTRIEYRHDEGQRTTATKQTNPDGTASGVVDTHDSTTAYKTGADGFWDAITVYKRTGVATKYSGAPGQDPSDRLLSGTTSTPI